MDSHTFKCGCLDVDYYHKDFNLKCPLVFELLKRSSFGIFQLEGHTSQKWIGEFAPASIEEVSDFTALARPGPLKSGMMDDYIGVKIGGVTPKFLHAALRPILERTNGALIYQEQIMEICRDIAGMTLVEADTIRKGVGKKKIEVLQKLSKEFIDGCLRSGYSKSFAEEVWGWIINFSGYGFCMSHAVCYSHIAYYMAWAKAHHPVEFYCSLLMSSNRGNKEQTETIHSIVNDAKLYGIKVVAPDIRRMNMDFDIVDDNTIAFGLTHIKGIGQSSLEDVKNCVGNTYENFLYNVLVESPKKTVVEGLLWSGALDYLKKSRFQINADINLTRGLSVKETAWLATNWSMVDKEGWTLYEIVEYLANEGNISQRQAVGDLIPNSRRRTTLNKLLLCHDGDRDSTNFLACLAKEKFYIGITLSGNETELYNSTYSSNDCIEFVDALNGTFFKFVCLVEKVRHHYDKNGNKMAFAKISDSSYMVENAVVFASTFAKSGHYIDDGNVVLLKGKKQGNAFLVNTVDSLC